MPNSAVQGDTATKERTLQTKAIGLWLIVACKLQCFSGRSKMICSPGPSTIDSIETVRFCAFAPPGSPLDYSAVIHLYCGMPGISNPPDIRRIANTRKAISPVCIRSDYLCLSFGTKSACPSPRGSDVSYWRYRRTLNEDHIADYHPHLFYVAWKLRLLVPVADAAKSVLAATKHHRGRTSHGKF